MAISKEDNHDVSKAFGKAIAKKIGRVTRDRYKSGGLSAGQRIERSLKDEKAGNVKKLDVKSKTIGTHNSSVTTKRGIGKVTLNKHPNWSVSDYRQHYKQNNKY